MIKSQDSLSISIENRFFKVTGQYCSYLEKMVDNCGKERPNLNIHRDSKYSKIKIIAKSNGFNRRLGNVLNDRNRQQESCEAYGTADKVL